MILVLFLLISNSHANKFSDYIQFNWTSARSLTFHIEKDKSILSPANTWIKILTVDRDCLFFKTPFKRSRGILEVRKNCSDSVATFDNIDQFAIRYKDFNLSLDIIIKGLQKIELIEMINLKNNGLLISGFNKKMVNKEARSFTKISLNNFKSFSVCHQINSRCEDIVEFNCDECAGPWYEVAGSSCPYKNNKFCGVNLCGEKGQPACPRGNDYFESHIPEVITCAPQSHTGICQRGLQKVCIEKNYLFCL